MHTTKLGAGLIVAVAALDMASISPARADETPTQPNAPVENVNPTYVGTTPEDVGVMDRARPAYDAKGIPLGAFRLFPTLDETESYNDNVFDLPSPQADFFTTTAPAVRLQSEWGRNFAEAYAGAEDYRYSEFTGNNITDWTIGTDGRYDVSHDSSVNAAVSYGELHESRTSPNTVGFQASPNQYYLTHGSVGATYQPNRIGVNIGGSIDHYQWKNTPLNGGGVLFNGTRDETNYQAYAKGIYDFSPGYSGFVRGSYDGRRFASLFDVSGYDRSADGYRVDAGLDVQLTHLVAGEVFLGYLNYSYPAIARPGLTPLGDVSGLDFGAKLDWFATQVLTVHLNASRQVQDVTIAGASAGDAKIVSLSADYELLRDVILQGNVGYVSTSYGGATSRTDSQPGAGLGVKYLVNRYVSAVANYSYGDRTSNITGVNYTDNLVSIGLALHI